MCNFPNILSIQINSANRLNIMNYLELICNIDNFAVRKWFREVYAFRMKREPGENPGQYPLL